MNGTKSVKRALQLLAYRRDAAGIAKYLSKRGLLHCAHPETGNCPVANYLVAETGASAASVGHWSGGLTFGVVPGNPTRGQDPSRSYPDWSNSEDFTIPEGVRDFIGSYDAGDFKHLANTTSETLNTEGERSFANA